MLARASPKSSVLLATLITAGLLAGGTILLIAGADFARLAGWLAIAPTLLFLTLLAVGGYNVGAAFVSDSRTASFLKRLMLLSVIPLAFLASALGCMGIELQGCTPACHWLTRGGIPAIAITAFVYLFFPSAFVLLALSVMSLAFLVPNCACYNVINARWIDLLGQSPACFSLAVTSALVAIAALHTGRAFLLAAASTWLAASMCAFFFVAHHYFHFPW